MAEATGRVKMSKEDFLAVIEWEGGVYDALEYGLTAADCADEKLASKWAKLEAVFAEHEGTKSDFAIELRDLWVETLTAEDPELGRQMG